MTSPSYNKSSELRVGVSKKEYKEHLSNVLGINPHLSLSKPGLVRQNIGCCHDKMATSPSNAACSGAAALKRAVREALVSWDHGAEYPLPSAKEFAAAGAGAGFMKTYALGGAHAFLADHVVDGRILMPVGAPDSAYQASACHRNCTKPCLIRVTCSLTASVLRGSGGKIPASGRSQTCTVLIKHQLCASAALIWDGCRFGTIALSCTAVAVLVVERTGMLHRC